MWDLRFGENRELVVGASILQKATRMGMWIFHCGISITGVGYATAGSVIRDGSGPIVFVNELKNFCYKQA